MGGGYIAHYMIELHTTTFCFLDRATLTCAVQYF